MIKGMIFFLYILTSSLVRCDDNIFMTIKELPEPGSNTSVVGPPGPVGLPGPKGTTGRIGTCQCDIERVRRQKAMVDKFKALLVDYDLVRVVFDFKQDPDSCSVGIKTGRLNDSAMTASSFTTQRPMYAPYRARLDNLHRNNENGGAWVPHGVPDINWLQVDLNQPTQVTGVISQGLQYSDGWITSFKISYSNETDQRGFIQEEGHDKIFIGNHDRATYKVNMFPEPITARYFRLYVITYNNAIVLRMELLTC